MPNKNNLDKAIRYIEAGLRTKLILEDIAEKANMSAWHFHRVFLASTGITVGEYIRKRRMSEAAKELVFTAKPIKQLAGEYQYESQEAFTRSFTVVYGVTPGKLRRQVGPLQYFNSISPLTKGVKMLKAKIKHMDAFRVVGITCENTMKNNNIPALWNDFNQQICSKVPDALHPGRVLGICYYLDHIEMNEDTPFTYLAGVEYPPEKDCPIGLVYRDVPAADYAVFEHHGSLDTLSETYDFIYNNWLPESGYERKKADDFELYDQRFQFGDSQSVMEIWVPVEKH
ncbi:MAG: AraC family transcriptional regulator [Candidatus Cloacimonetes bacterium]|jgi:AraC family transcriptional regulator|nr:AraC family transcriptional regulator [Candidatus Cloacimonadota bacterium]MDD2506894.1 AraC family transcriptional regulator [Candidatus Cloacimonadota bacterium]MDD4560401.1 AraC family transcriptional regulator [Candidatus Cloacimonadota bacterium]